MTRGKLFIWSTRDTAPPMELAMVFTAFCVTATAAPTIAPDLRNPPPKADAAPAPALDDRAPVLE